MKVLAGVDNRGHRAVQQNTVVCRKSRWSTWKTVKWTSAVMTMMMKMTWKTLQGVMKAGALQGIWASVPQVCCHCTDVH